MPRALVAFLAFVLALVAALDARADGGESLLARRAPSQVHGVRNAAALTDGVAAFEGDAWKTTLTTQLVGTSAFAIYDLGSAQAITAAWLQADNNDTYVLEGSLDGQSFVPLWEAKPVPDAGLRARRASGLATSARYVRLRATGGDASYALSELLLYGEEAPRPFPPNVPRVAGVSLDDLARDRVLVFGVALIAATLLAFRGASVGWTAFVALMPIAAAVPLATTLSDAWPVPSRAVALVRGVAAAVALVAVLRELVAIKRFPVDRRFTLGALAIAAVTSLLAFYNLGHPQFVYANGRSTFAHYHDLRQYHPTAKFFEELGYRGIYEADVAAYAESVGVTVDSLADVKMRDLSAIDQEVTTIGAKKDAIAARKARFSPARWEEYKRDAAFFRGFMGTDLYLETMLDFGGNATPVWMATAQLLFRGAPSTKMFTATGLIDLALLLLAFGAIHKAFGLRTMLVSAVVFGANDLYNYGTNWGGATLRHDWLVYLALGVCALRLKRPAVGGALLAASAMIRAFPVLAIAAIAMPVVWWIVDHRLREKRWPTIATLRAENEDAEQALYAAAITAAVLFVGSSLLLSTGAWVEWYAKVREAHAVPHMADVSFRELIGGWSNDRSAILSRRLPLVLSGVGTMVGMAFVAARGMPISRAAILGLPLVPTLLNPVSYYAHIVFLLALLVDARPGEGAPVTRQVGAIWSVLLVMCMGQYFSQLIPDMPLHFYFNTVLLMVACGAVLLVLVRERASVAGWLGGDADR